MIVVQVKTLDGSGTQTTAIFNDVETLLRLRAAAIEEAPHLGAIIETAYLLGIPRVEAAMKTLLHIEGVRGAKVVQEIKSAVV